MTTRPVRLSSLFGIGMNRPEFCLISQTASSPFASAEKPDLCRSAEGVEPNSSPDLRGGWEKSVVEFRRGALKPDSLIERASLRRGRSGYLSQ